MAHTAPAALDVYVAEFEIEDDRGQRVETRVFTGDDAALMRAFCEDEDPDLLDEDDDGLADAISEALAARAILGRIGLSLDELPF